MNIRRIVTSAALGLGLLLTGCGSPGPVTVVEREHELAGWDAGERKCTKWKNGKCTKYKTSPPKWEDECFEIEWSDGSEACVTRQEFETDPRFQIGAVKV